MRARLERERANVKAAQEEASALRRAQERERAEARQSLAQLEANLARTQQVCCVRSLCMVFCFYTSPLPISKVNYSCTGPYPRPILFCRFFLNRFFSVVLVEPHFVSTHIDFHRAAERPKKIESARKRT